jgi:serine/threonine protein kinase
MGDDRPGAVRFFSGFPVGTRIAGYRLEEQIGQGGMAVVFRAQDERLQRQVALKILSPALAADNEFRHRFIRESRSVATVDDPHIIPVFEAGDADGVLFIAMRYVPGGDAGTLVRDEGPLPPARAAAIISAVASALDAAHAAGLVHRDVKPANMLVDARPGRPDHVYLSDFGLTKGALPMVSQAGTGHILGTPNYCAPEQIRGQQVDARTDEYALACAVYTLLSGEPPFPRDEVMAVMFAHLSAEPPRLTSRRPGLSPAVDDVVLRALAKAPGDRYASCGEFADALRLALGLQPYDSDVAIQLHQRSLVDQQHRLGLDHADTLANRGSSARPPASRPSDAEAGDGALGSGAAPGEKREEPAEGDAGDRPPTRYLTGSLPERAPAGRPISLQVQITMAAPAGPSAALRPLAVPAEGRTVTIIVAAPGLESQGDLEQDVHVPAAGNSDPVRFRFTTGRAGLHPVTVRAFAGGTFLAELGLQVSVEIGAALEEGPPQSAIMDGLATEPGEVTLLVNLTDEGRYSFQLIGEALYPIELTRRLAGDPAEIVQDLVDELRAMAGQESPYANPRLVRNRIRSLGAQLWADVVPESIRRQFWEQAGRIKLFTVASDMDTVPWELLYPIDGDNDNGFLVEQFPVVRRVYGQGRARHLRLTSAGFVVPPGSPANAMDEVDAVRVRLGAHVEHDTVCTQLESLIRLLNAPPSVLHFACHNKFSDRAGSVIRLGGGPLRPGDLAPARLSRSMAAVSPLVFINACRTAGEIPGLMEMMGWARQFMGAGAGAFVGSLWTIRSGSARSFADAFYRALVVDGQPLGAASLQARQAIAGDEGDPTWLAYTIYGNPAATIQ